MACPHLEEDGPLEAQLDAVDVDGVPGDGDAVPAAAHGPVGTAQRPLQTQADHLRRRRGDLVTGEDKFERSF